MKTYTVKKGDTLSKIAGTYKTSVNALKMANSHLVKNVNEIKVGWVLNIPEQVANDSERFEKIGVAFQKCLNDIQKLESYKELESLL